MASTEASATATTSAASTNLTRRQARSATHIIAVRIDDPAVISRLGDLQSALKSRVPESAPALTNLSRAHITLAALHVHESDTHAAVVAAMRSQDVKDILSEAFPNESSPPSVGFGGLSTFDNGRVLVCPVVKDDSAVAVRLVELSAALRKLLAERLPDGSVEKPKNGTMETSMHIVVAKGRSFRRGRSTVNFTPEVVEALGTVDLGRQKFAKLELLTTLTGGLRTIAHADFPNCPATPDNEEPEDVAVLPPRQVAAPKKQPQPKQLQLTTSAGAAGKPQPTETTAMSDAEELKRWRMFAPELMRILLRCDPKLASMIPSTVAPAEMPKKRRLNSRQRKRLAQMKYSAQAGKAPALEQTHAQAETEATQ